MILTSYYANWRKYPAHKSPVAISIYPPKGFTGDLDNTLAPTNEILRLYKDGSIDDAEYEAMFRKDVLSKLNPKQVLKRHKDSILLCFEKRGDFCHRHIVSAWLNENDIEAEELLNEPPMRIAVVGSRDFNDWERFISLMNSMVRPYQRVVLVSGGAKGADKFAELYAKTTGIDIAIHPADWDGQGKAAGFIRNKTIWDDSDLGIAFWDGKSKGTKHSFDLAHKQNKELFIWNAATNKLTLNPR